MKNKNVGSIYSNSITNAQRWVKFRQSVDSKKHSGYWNSGVYAWTGQFLNKNPYGYWTVYDNRKQQNSCNVLIPIDEFSNLYITDSGNVYISHMWSDRIFSSNQEISLFEFAKYLKMRYTNYERFVAGFLNPLLKTLPQEENPFYQILSYLELEYRHATKFTYAEAFKLPRTFSPIVFGSISVPDMIAELGHERVAVAGQAVKHKSFSSNGEFLGYKEYDVIFETHRVNGRKMGISDAYAIRCWCTTTENEHWIWIEDKYANDPLEAIASTFRIHENLVPFIKELKRQGDILLVELTKDIDPRGDLVSLTKDQYFSLLTAQS